MRINRNVLFAGLVGGLVFSGQFALADLMDELMLYLSFDDGTAVDSSCNGFDGEEYGPSACQGISGQAMCFTDTEQDYITIPDIEAFAWNNEPVTFSLWTQVKDNPPMLYRDYISLGSEFGSEPTIELGKYRGGQWEGRIFMIVHLGGWDYSAACSDLTGPELAATPDRWIHVAGVYDAETGEVDLYINGDLQSDHRGEATIWYDFTGVDDLTLNIGQHCETAHPSTWHNGPLDEVRIYKRALSEAEINSLYYMHKQCHPDLTGDGVVDVLDLLELLGAWGACP